MQRVVKKRHILSSRYSVRRSDEYRRSTKVHSTVKDEGIRHVDIEWKSHCSKKKIYIVPEAREPLLLKRDRAARYN